MSPLPRRELMAAIRRMSSLHHREHRLPQAFAAGEGTLSDIIRARQQSMSRQQQQQGNEEFTDDQRKAFRVLLESMVSMSSGFDYIPKDVTRSEAIGVDSWPRAQEGDTKEIQQPPRWLLPGADLIPLERKEKNKPPVATLTAAQQRRLDTRTLEEALRRSNENGDVRMTIELFEKAEREGMELRQGLLLDGFELVSGEDPAAAYEMLRSLSRRDGTKKMYARRLRTLCRSIITPDRNKVTTTSLLAFADRLLQDLEVADGFVQQQLYPDLVTIFARQKNPILGPYANVCYKKMIELDFEMKPRWLANLLPLSKYTRQTDLPFHDILSRLSDDESAPTRLAAFLSVHNMFPYTQGEEMRVSLQSLVGFEKQWMEENAAAPTTTTTKQRTNASLPFYSIDLATLEMISTGAARTGNSQQIYHVWDLLDQYGYSPTETIYENTVVALASSEDVNGVQAAFATMATMKNAGMIIELPLIRSFSLAIRSKREWIKNALGVLLESQSTTGSGILSVESMNVILSSHAERGDYHDVYANIQLMQDMEIIPNVDSFSFAMEALGKHLLRVDRNERQRQRQHHHHLHESPQERTLRLADNILEQMEELGIRPNTHVVRNYVELLCLAGEVSTATSVVNSCLDEKAGPARTVVNNKTLYRVAMANANEGNYRTALHLSSLMTEPMPVLERKLQQMEEQQEED